MLAIQISLVKIVTLKLKLLKLAQCFKISSVNVVILAIEISSVNVIYLLPI